MVPRSRCVYTEYTRGYIIGLGTGSVIISIKMDLVCAIAALPNPSEHRYHQPWGVVRPNV